MILKAFEVVFFICLAKGLVASPVSVKTEKYLRQHLFQNYDRLVRPVKDSNHVVNVQVQITPLVLRSMDFESHIMKLDTWLTVQWHDEYLQWDPKEFGGLEYFNLPCSEVWKPDIAVYTGSPDSANVPQVQTNVQIRFNGEVLWVPPFTIENRCPTWKLSIPERYECDISVLSWTYDITQLDLDIRNETTMEYFEDTNRDWHLEFLTPVRENKLFSCCKEYYPTIHFKTVVTKRRKN